MSMTSSPSTSPIESPGSNESPENYSECGAFGHVQCINGMDAIDSSRTCAEACGGKCCQGDMACDGFTGSICKVRFNRSSASLVLMYCEHLLIHPFSRCTISYIVG